MSVQFLYFYSVAIYLTLQLFFESSCLIFIIPLSDATRTGNLSMLQAFAAPQHYCGIYMYFLFEEKSAAAEETTGLQSSYAAIPSFHARFCFSD